MSMRAAVIAGPAQFRIDRVAVPETPAGAVRIQLEGCGVCGSNLPPWEGRPWFSYPFSPGEPGHEGWGTVDAVGEDVTAFKAGDRVAALSYRAYAEFDIAQADAVVKLPAALDGRPFPGEALGCAMNVFKRSAIQPGQHVAVIGIGFLGGLLVGLAAAAGARVVALSRRQFALECARQMKAAEVISLTREHQQIVGVVREMTGGNGCDCVIEATGQQEPLDLASELTRERGRLVIAGYHQDGMRQVNMQLWNWRGLDVINAHERDPAVYRQGMSEAVEAVVSGRLDPFPLLTHRFSLEKINEAFLSMRDREGAYLKSLISYE